jgi:hypothetical protein
VSTVSIPMLPQAISLTGAEQMEAVQAGNSVRVTAAQIAGLSFGAGETGFLVGNQNPIPGVAMQIDNLLENEPAAFPLQNEAGIWSTTSYTYAGFSQTMTASTVPGQGSIGELATLFAFANNNGAIAPVTALLADAVARQNTGFVNAANFIARNDTGVNGAKLVGLEIDVQTVLGTTLGAGSAGLFINIFNAVSSAPAMQINGNAGGTWLNGIVSNGVSNAHFTVQTGASASIFGVNLTQGTYSNSALALGPSVGTGGINFGGGNFGGNPFMWGDSTKNLNIDMGTTPGNLTLVDGPSILFQIAPTASSVNFMQITSATTSHPVVIAATGSDTDVSLDIFCKGAGLVKFNGAAHFTANGSVATTMTSLGPTGSHTTVQEWLTILDATGVVRYIPCY